MKQVVIIGCPGSGKTTFAKTLAMATHLPLIHLDLYYHEKQHDYPNNKEAWRAKIRELTSKVSWIIDGNYKSTFDIRLPAADTIIFLDYPRRIVVWRMFKRRLRYQFKRRDDMPESWHEHISWDFFKFVWNFQRLVRPKVMALLETYAPVGTIITLHDQHEADAFLLSQK